MSERIAYRTQLTNQDQHITSSDYLRLLAVRKKKKKEKEPSSGRRPAGRDLFSSRLLLSSVFIAIHIPISLFPPLPQSPFHTPSCIILIFFFSLLYY